MSERPLVSVVIPAFNAETTIVRAIQSVLVASQKADLAEQCQILVIDDGSTDSTSKRVRDAFESPHVRLLHHEQRRNRGVSATRNLGIESSDSEYISFLDGDDTFCPNRFDCILSILEADSTIDAVYGDTVVVIEDESQQSTWKEGQYFGVGEACTGPSLLSRLIHSHPWATSAITARRRLLNRTGLFNEALSVAEDCHLWMRMAAIGKIVPNGTSDPVSVYHRQADSLYRVGVDNKWHYSRALQLFYRWLKKQTASDEVLQVARREIGAWLDNAFIQLRSEKRTGMLTRMLVDWTSVAPELTLRRRNLSHVAHALIGR